MLKDTLAAALKATSTMLFAFTAIVAMPFVVLLLAVVAAVVVEVVVVVVVAVVALPSFVSGWSKVVEC